MATINVTITDDKELASKLVTFAGGHLGLSRSMGAVSLYLTRFWSGEVFASRGQVIGQPWPALYPNYAAFKAREFPGCPPLIRSGLMNRSFKSKSTPLTTSLWNEAKYFDYHQEGRGVPERVMMLVAQARELRIAKFVVSDLTTQMNSAGPL